jgi:alpha-D-ribose 1-methylphosphonate 5-triphosphate synthase subunit PhnG
MTDKSMAVQAATYEGTNAAMLAARGRAAEAKQEFEMAEEKQTAAKVRLTEAQEQYEAAWATAARAKEELESAQAAEAVAQQADMVGSEILHGRSC